MAPWNYRPFQRLRVNESRTGPMQMTIKAAPLKDENPKIHPAPTSNTEKNPDDWVSGASKRIDALKARLAKE